MDAEGGPVVLPCADGMAGDALASGKAHHLPVAGASLVLSFDKKVQVALLFLGVTTCPCATDVQSRRSLSLKACSKSPLEVRDAFAGSRAAFFGRPEESDGQMEVNGRLKFGPIFVRGAIFVSAPRERAHARGPWNAANGPARGMYNRVAASDRLSSRSISNEVKSHLNTMLSHSGFPAKRLAHRSNPARLYTWQDDDSD